MNVFLFTFGEDDTLHVLKKSDYTNRVNGLKLREAKSLTMRSLGLPDLLINPKTREVLGIVYSDFNPSLELQNIVKELGSKYINLYSDNSTNIMHRYNNFSANSRLEIFWGSLVDCVLEPASLMGDVWFENDSGDIGAFALELYQFWDDKYHTYPTGLIML